MWVHIRVELLLSSSSLAIARLVEEATKAKKMWFENLLAPLIALAGTPLWLYLLKPVAKGIQLVDHPDDDRKRHNGVVPLTGGLAVFLSLVLALSVSSVTGPDLGMPVSFWPLLLGLLALLVITHAVDDILELNATARLLVDGALALCICTWALVKVTTLGELFGMGEVTLGRFAIAMTVFCFIAASNAFNMTDGIDGLCSGFGLIAFSTLIVMLVINGDPAAASLITVSAIVICAIVPMYLANLGKFGPAFRSFLGDSGARLTGFMAAIAIIIAASRGFIDPVFAFFPIAVPVCDCLVLMAVRTADRRSPFSADRWHLHHLLVDNGLTSCQARRAEIWMGVALAAIGVGLHAAGTREWVVSILVVSLFAAFIALRFWLAGRARTRIAAIVVEPRHPEFSPDVFRANIGS